MPRGVRACAAASCAAVLLLAASARAGERLEDGDLSLQLPDSVKVCFLWPRERYVAGCVAGLPAPPERLPKTGTQIVATGVLADGDRQLAIFILGRNDVSGPPVTEKTLPDVVKGFVDTARKARVPGPLHGDPDARAIEPNGIGVARIAARYDAKQPMQARGLNFIIPRKAASDSLSFFTSDADAQTVEKIADDTIATLAVRDAAPAQRDESASFKLGYWLGSLVPIVAIIVALLWKRRAKRSSEAPPP